MSPDEQAAWDQVKAANARVKALLAAGAVDYDPALNAACDQALAALRDYALTAGLNVPGVTS